MEVQVKYFNSHMPIIEKIAKGDWIDLRVDRIETVDPEKKLYGSRYCNANYIAPGMPNRREGMLDWELGAHYDKYKNPIAYEFVKFRRGEFLKIYLGVGMKLPEGHEALIALRGSSCKNYGIVQVNAPGVVDESYCGDNDEWFIPCVALFDGVIERYDRICQFKIEKKMPEINFTTVTHLSEVDRGGFGSTGTK